MNLSIDSTVTLNNGVTIPQLGLGVWKVDNAGTSESVQWAIKHGYRAIDTAKQYGNEAGVDDGLTKALSDNGLKREDIFLTTKIFNGDQRYESTLKNFEDQLKALQTDYVDLLLIHWPVNDKYLETSRALETIYRDGKACAIGVSNFNISRLKTILKTASIKPVVDQMKFNPFCQETDIKEFCDAHNIHLEAWSPLGGARVLENPTIADLGKKYHKSVAQIILRWDLQREIITIPKSVHEARIIENADIYDFSLTDDDINLINGLNNEDHSLWYGGFEWSGNPLGVPDKVQDWEDDKESSVK